MWVETFTGLRGQQFMRLLKAVRERAGDGTLLTVEPCARRTRPVCSPQPCVASSSGLASCSHSHPCPVRSTRRTGCGS